MSIAQKIIGSGLLLLLTIILGVWLSSSGKPYNGIIFNIHKLIALALVLFTSISFYSLLKNAEIISIVVLIIITILSVIALFVSGAFLSIGNTPYSLLKNVHIISAVVVTGTSSAVIYIINHNNLLK